MKWPWRRCDHQWITYRQRRYGFFGEWRGETHVAGRDCSACGALDILTESPYSEWQRVPASDVWLTRSALQMEHSLADEAVRCLIELLEPTRNRVEST